MKITIKVRTCAEDLTPEQAEKAYGFTKGFAKSVRGQIKSAKLIDPNSRWGWCTVDVIAIMDVGGVRLEGCDSLGGCSYTSELDFVKNSGYFDDMVLRAIHRAIEKFNGSMAKAIGATLMQFAS